MKQSLIKKFIFLYVCIILFIYIIVTTFTYKQINKFLIEEKKETLQKEALAIANEFNSYYYSGQMNNNNLEIYMNYIDRAYNARIWLVNCDGNIIADSRNKYVNNSSININDLNENLLSSSFTEIGDFYGFFNEKMISVGLPIRNQKNELLGAFIIHSSFNDIKSKASYVFTIGYITLSFGFLTFFLFIYFYIRKIVVNLTVMNKAAHNFANGDFNNTIKVSSEDELGQLANSFNYMAQELSKLEEFRQQFIANISHDFRSPLTSIKGYVGAILDGTIPTENQDKYLNIVLDETDRLNKLTSDILFLTKFQTQKIDLNYTSFDIHHVIRKVVDLFEHKCTQKNIKVILSFNSKELFVYADVDRIQQVVYNLFDNAIKFTNANGSITIETADKNNNASISIKNTGEGIRPEEINHIWDRFYKADPSRGKSKGTGLGLSIVKEILKAHKQTIKVNSVVNEYTKFTFYLSK